MFRSLAVAALFAAPLADQVRTNWPDEERAALGDPRLRATVNQMQGEWTVTRLTLDRRDVRISDLAGLRYIVDGQVIKQSELADRVVKPLAPVSWRNETADEDATRMIMSYVSEGRVRIGWWDRFGETRDPYNLRNDPAWREADPALGTIDLVGETMTINVRGVGLRGLLPDRFLAPIGTERTVTIVLERGRKKVDPPIVPVPDGVPPPKSLERGGSDAPIRQVIQPPQPKTIRPGR